MKGVIGQHPIPRGSLAVPDPVEVAGVEVSGPGSLIATLLGDRCTEGCVLLVVSRHLQGYLAHKKQPPPPRTTIGP